MKTCNSCFKQLNDDDVFCRYCGAKQGEDGMGSLDLQPRKSLMLKYSGYLNNDVLYKIAYAKENGMVKNEFEGEAEEIYKILALRGHTDSMYKYANILLAKNPPQTELAMRWFNVAAKAGHTPSINYLRTCDPNYAPRANAYTAGSQVAQPQTPSSYFSGDKLSGEDIYSLMEGSVVEIVVQNDRNGAMASGFCVSDGFIVTNAHAVMTANGGVYPEIYVYFGGKHYEAELVALGRPVDGKHDTVDIALLFVGGLIGKMRPVDFGCSADNKNGQKVYLIGNSLGEGTCITSGIISDKERAMKGLSYPYIMTDAAANHGNSGGPLLNENGKVIGVLVAGIENAKGMNYAIPIDVVAAFLEYVAGKTQLENYIFQGATKSGEAGGSKDVVVALTTAFAGVQLLLNAIALIKSFFDKN